MIKINYTPAKLFTLFLLAVCLIFETGSAQERTAFGLSQQQQLFEEINLDLAGLETVKSAVKAKDYRAAAAAYLHFRLKESKTQWPVRKEEDDALIKPINKAVLDSICNHYIYDNVTAHPYVPYAVDMGRDFDWTHNPLAPTDPNFSREWTWVVISRMKFLNQLSDGYYRLGEEKYGKKSLFFLRDFYQKASTDIKSKTNRELLWRGLEVAIRSSTLANVYYNVKNMPSFTAEDQLLVSTLALQHGKRLMAILTADPTRTGNHVTTESYGLFVIGSLFPELKEAAAWRSEAIRRFKKEIDRVVPPDGLQAELSPSYHYGVVTPYHGFYNVAIKNNIELPADFLDRLKDMYRAPVLIMDQNGGLVPTNDSSPRDVRKLSKKGLELGDDPLLLWAASGGKRGSSPPTSTSLPYAGFYSMRSGWKPNDLFLFFRGGPEGIGHAEQDMLQVVLRAYGKTLLFDPGKYSYDQSDWRRFSINTPSHNTIIVDGKWQNREKKAPGNYVPTGNPWFTSPFFDFVSASYNAGYETNIYDPTKTYRPQKWKGDRDTTVTHHRKVIYIKPAMVLVIDELQASGKHVYDAHFHIDAPSAKLDNSTQSIVSQRSDSVQIALYPLQLKNLNTTIVQGQKEPLLGWMPVEQRPIPTARFRKVQEGDATFATLLYPFRGKQLEMQNKEIKVSGKSVLGYALSQEKINTEVFISRGSVQSQFSFKSSLIGKTNVSAAGMIITKMKDQSSVKIAGWNISQFSGFSTAFTVSLPTVINFVERKGYLTIGNLGEQAVVVTFAAPYQKAVTLEAGEWKDVSSKGEKKIITPKVPSL